MVKSTRTRLQSNVIVFENLRFRPRTLKRVTGIFKNTHSGERFQNLPFSVIENAVDGSPERRKISPFNFQKYPDTCGRSLRVPIMTISIFREVIIANDGMRLANEEVIIAR